jgi:hypothetical protein
MPLEISVNSVYLSAALVFPSQTNPDAQIADYLFRSILTYVGDGFLVRTEIFWSKAHRMFAQFVRKAIKSDEETPSEDENYFWRANVLYFV